MAVDDIGRVAEGQVDAGKPQRRQAGGVFRQADPVVRVEPIDHMDPKLFGRPRRCEALHVRVKCVWLQLLFQFFPLACLTTQL